jgi:hypothetical protein
MKYTVNKSHNRLKLYVLEIFCIEILLTKSKKIPCAEFDSNIKSIFNQSILLKYLHKELYWLIFPAPGGSAHAKHGTAFRAANILTVPVSDCTSDGRFGRYFSSKAMQMGVRTL